MLSRLGRLRISLAAKCQLLFGAAVVLIIVAALLVPWQRMEQLMEKINERAAESLADNALNEHVLKRVPSTGPVTIDGKIFSAPRIVGVKSGNNEQLTKLERTALKTFQDHPQLPFVSHSYDAKDGTARYAYIRPLTATR